MIKMLMAFFVAFGIFYIGIPTYRNLSGKDKWDLTKLFFFSIMCSILAIILLVFFVVLF
jgi:hypothetical protein